MEKSRGKSETAPVGLGCRLVGGRGALRRRWLTPGYGSGSRAVFAFLLKDDFHCNNFAPVRRQPGVRSIFMARRKCLFCACSFPSFLFCPLFPVLQEKERKIPSRFAVYRVVLNTSKSIQQTVQCDSGP